MNVKPAAERTVRRTPALEIQARRTIRKYHMLESGEHVLAAVSGGADSVALLLCLHKLSPKMGLKLTVAHLNHRLRGAESDADLEFARRLSSELGLAFVSEAVEVRPKAAEQHANLEEVARQVRYDFLRRTAARIGAQKIAVGHTLNDQAETVLMRILRGSGPEGLAAIHPTVGGVIIRPLLECTRRQVLAYLETQGATYREDSSNRDRNYRRNRLRLELFPYLEDNFNPRLLQSLAREASAAREVSHYLELEARKAFESIHISLPKGIAVPVEALLELHPALQKLVVRQALRQVRGSLRGITSRHVDQMLLLCRPLRSGRVIYLPGGTCAERRFDNVVISREEGAAPIPFRYELPIPGRCAIPEAGLELHARVEKRAESEHPLTGASDLAFLDPDAIPSVLIVRSRLPGDRYGGPRHRKVKKMLINSRIDLRQRSRIPMVVAGNAVIWIPGFRPARAFAAKADSKGIVVLEARK